jgi:hypothetical protein
MTDGRTVIDDDGDDYRGFLEYRLSVAEDEVRAKTIEIEMLSCGVPTAVTLLRSDLAKLLGKNEDMDEPFWVHLAVSDLCKCLKTGNSTGSTVAASKKRNRKHS